MHSFDWEKKGKKRKKEKRNMAASNKLLADLLQEELELECDIQDLSDCPGPMSVVNSWSDGIRERFKRIEKLLQAVKKVAVEQDRESEKKVLLDKAERHETQCKEYVEYLEKDWRAQHDVDSFLFFSFLFFFS